jgi:hypothetical protein
MTTQKFKRLPYGNTFTEKIQIVKEEGIAAEILETFPLNKINNDEYFISLN